MSDNLLGTEKIEFRPFDGSLTIDKIESFANMQEGWCFGEGGAITRAVIDAAVSIHKALVASGFTFTDAFPGASGEAQVTAYHEAHFVSAIVEPDRTMSFLHQRDKNDVAAPVEGATIEQVKNAIQEAAKSIWNTSDMCIQNTSIKIVSASPSWHSRSRPRIDASRSLSEVA